MHTHHSLSRSQSQGHSQDFMYMEIMSPSVCSVPNTHTKNREIDILFTFSVNAISSHGSPDSHLNILSMKVLESAYKMHKLN